MFTQAHALHFWIDPAPAIFSSGKGAGRRAAENHVVVFDHAEERQFRPSFSRPRATRVLSCSNGVINCKIPPRSSNAASRKVSSRFCDHCAHTIVLNSSSKSAPSVSTGTMCARGNAALHSATQEAVRHRRKTTQRHLFSHRAGLFNVNFSDCSVVFINQVFM